ncbi:MAG: hypothetical protein HYT27_00290 [Parcubacteria group bacterium]|nr:hypothetical protein [Parcubacteria group bacterium]
MEKFPSHSKSPIKKPRLRAKSESLPTKKEETHTEKYKTITDKEKEWLEEGVPSLVHKMLEKFNGELPDAIVYTDTSGRPLRTVFDPILSKLSKERGKKKPAIFYFAPPDSPGTSSDEKQIKIDIKRRALEKERAQEIKAWVEKGGGNPDRIAVIDEFGMVGRTLNRMKRAFGEDTPFFYLAAEEPSGNYRIMSDNVGVFVGYQGWDKAGRYSWWQRSGVQREEMRKYAAKSDADPSETKYLKDLHRELRELGNSIADKFQIDRKIAASSLEEHEKEDFEEKTSEMRFVARLEEKSEKKEKFSLDELQFLYGSGSEWEHGDEEESRLAEIRMHRDFVKDMRDLFGLSEAFTVDQIGANLVAKNTDFFYKYISRLHGLSNETVKALLATDDEEKIRNFSRNLEHFKNLSEETALLIIQRGASLFGEDLSNFKGLSDRTAKALMDSGQWSVLADHMEQFKHLSKETALALIDYRKGKAYSGAPEVLQHISSFDGLSADDSLAQIYCERGIGHLIGNYVDHFTGPFSLKTAQLLIRGGNTNVINQNLNRFEGLTREIAIELIRNDFHSGANQVLKHLERFSGLNADDSLAQAILQTGDSYKPNAYAVIKHIDRFKNLSQQTAQILYDYQYDPSIILNHLSSFADLSPEFIERLKRSVERQKAA